MAPGPATALSASEVYEILRKAATRRQPVAATSDGQARLICPHFGGRKLVSGTSFATSSEELATVPSRWARRAEAFGVVSRWRNSAKSSCVWGHGTQSRAPIGRPALKKSISISMLNSEMSRKRDSEATAALADALQRCVASQSNADYVARGEGGDPRGRKSGVGLGTTNLRWPALAQGKNGSARPPGTHRPQCRAWRGDEIRANCGLQSVLIPTLVLTPGNRVR